MNTKVESKWLFIDIIKIFAAFVLVVYHFRHLIIYDAQVKNILMPPLSPYLYPLYKYGDFMVELLIVISGFTSAHAQINKISEGTISLFDFISKKFKKFYPIYLITTLLCIILQYLHVYYNGTMTLGLGKYTYIDFIVNIFMLGCGIFSTKITFNVPAWFITGIFISYFLFYMLSRCKRENNIILSFCAVIFAVIGLMHAWNYPIFNERILRIIFSFISGVLLYIICDKTKNYNTSICGGVNIFLILTFFCFLKFNAIGNRRIAASFISLFLVYGLWLTTNFSLCLNTKNIKKYIVSLSNYSYSIILSHYAILILIKLLNVNKYLYSSSILLVVYCLLSVILAYLVKKFSNFVLKKIGDTQ